MALNEDGCEFSAEIVPLYDGIMIIFATGHKDDHVGEKKISC